MSILCRDVEALRHKCAAFEGELKEYWDAFLRRARAHPREHAIDNAVAFLATGEGAYAEQFTAVFAELIATLPSRDLTNQGQFHQWTNALPLTRWLLAWDLLAEVDEGAGALRRDAAQAFLGYARRQFLPVMESRLETGDNQFFAVAFACRVVGHLFGEVHAGFAQARELGAAAERRLALALGALPPGGYSGEGYYHNQVVATLATLFCAAEESITGTALFDHPWAPHNVRVRDILEADCEQVLPGGLVLPWDASYYHPLHVKMNLVWLARRSGEAQVLAPIRRWRLFEGDPRPGWGRDDDAWTWLWWPDSITSLDAVPDWRVTSWARRHVGFGLFDPEGETGLVQACDHHLHRESPASSRCQTDPNQIILVGRGTPLLLDGGWPVLPEGLDQTLPALSGRSGRTGVGHHSCIVIDHHYALGAPDTGHGNLVRHVPFPVLSLGEAEVGAVYRELAVQEMTRRSLHIGAGSYLVVDRVRADHNIAVTWQVFARPYARANDGGITVDTPEQVRLQILPLQKALWQVDECAGMPVVLENRCHRIAATTSGNDMTLAHLIAVEPRTEAIADLSSGWQVEEADTGPAGATVELRRGLAAQLGNHIPSPLPQRYIWDYMDRRRHSECGGVYDRVDFGRSVSVTRTLQVPEEAASQDLFLRFSRPTWYFRLEIDGEGLAGDSVEDPVGFGEENVVAPLVVPLPKPSAPDHTYTVRLTIASPYPTTAMGTVTLERACPRDPIEFCACDDGAEVERTGKHLYVLPDNPGHSRCTIGPLQTDATCAVWRDEGHWMAVEITTLIQDGNALVTARRGRTTLSYQDGALWLDHIDPDAVVLCRIPEGEITLIGGAVPVAHRRLTKPLTICVHSREGLPEQANLLASNLASCDVDGVWHRCRLEPAPVDACLLAQLRQGNAWEREDAVAALADAADAEVQTALIACLNDPAWNVQIAAARALGWRSCRTAGPALQACLEKENAGDVYNGICGQESFPQYPGGSGPDPLTDLGDLPAEAANIPEPGAVSTFCKRWRLKQALLEAIGLVGDEDAVPLLVATLEGSDAAGLGMTGGEFYPVRKAAAEALGRIGGKAALEALHRIAVTEVEANARTAAEEALAWHAGRIRTEGDLVSVPSCR